MPEYLILFLGIFTWPTCQKIYSFCKNRWEMHKSKEWSLSGDYLSSYEDEELCRGTKKLIMKMAPVVINQNKTTLTGSTTMESENKTWEIEGRLTKTDCVHGLYYGTKFNSKSFGNFLLKLNNNGVMEGFWIGFDSEQNRILTGKYTLRKKIKASITKAQLADIPVVAAIANDLLGRDYLPNQAIRAPISQQGIFFNNIAKVDDKTVGFISYCLVEKDDLYTMLPSDPDVDKCIEQCEKIGILYALAVKDEYSDRGIGSELVESALHDLSAANCPTILAFVWLQTEHDPATSILPRFGFQNLTKFNLASAQNEFSKEHVSSIWSCPPRKNIASFYVK